MKPVGAGNVVGIIESEYETTKVRARRIAEAILENLK